MQEGNLKKFGFLGRPAAALTLAAGMIIGGLGAAKIGRTSAVNPPATYKLANPAEGPSRTGFGPVVKKAQPQVVNISTSKVVKTPTGFSGGQMDPLFRQFFGGEMPEGRNRAPRARKEHSLGSGVIVSPEGYILTNNHVVDGATDVRVTMGDKREFQARVVGTDPQIDIAILKIDADHLPAITIGDSSQVQVGDYALAIGNPFGVGQTVTMGIISATGRNQLGLNNYEDFIQTDAAINPGNSGGALVDANGNLTGINTAIFSKSGGSQGIGFAIPVKLAMEVMKSIIEHGQVIRGWLGIEVQPLTQELAESFGLSGRPGIVVAGIFRDGPAQKAGLQLGDVILSIDGEPAGDGRRSMNQVARIKPTDKVTIQVMRNGKELKLTAEIGLRPPPAPVKEKEE